MARSECNACCGKNTTGHSHTPAVLTNSVQPNEKTAIEKQKEGSLTLAEEKPKAEAIWIAKENDEIDLAGQQAAQWFRRTWHFSKWPRQHQPSAGAPPGDEKPEKVSSEPVFSAKKICHLCDREAAQVSEHWPLWHRIFVLLWLSSRRWDKKSQEKAVQCFLQN